MRAAPVIRAPTGWSEAEATEHFSHRDRTYWIRPDGAGVYWIGERWVPFLLEYDRDTMRYRDYVRKLAGIAAFYESASYRSFFVRRPTLFVVAEHDAGEERFLAAVDRHAVDFDIELPMLFTARWRFERNPKNRAGTLGPIWRTPASPLRSCWLDDPDLGPR